MIYSQSRQVGGVAPSWFFFFSLLLHAGIFLMILLYHDTRPKGFPSATTVELVSEVPVQDTRLHKSAQEVHPPKPVPHPVRVVPKPAPKHVRLERHATIRVHPPKPRPKKVAPHHLGHKIKKVHSQKKTSLPPKSVPHHVVPRQVKKTHPDIKPVSHTSPVENPNPSPVKMDIAGQAFPTFLEHLLISRIKSNWFPPPGTKGLRATVTFTLKKNGQLSGEPSIVSGSGNGMFDDAARMAVLRSVPFPPFPSSYTKDQESVTVTLEAIHHGGVFDGP